MGVPFDLDCLKHSTLLLLSAVIDPPLQSRSDHTAVIAMMTRTRTPHCALLVVLGSGGMWSSSTVPGPAKCEPKTIMKVAPELPGARGPIRAKPTKQLCLILLLGVLMIGTTCPASAASEPPNILFIIMDDVGIDQLQAFNPLARVATPKIDTVIADGGRFTVSW